MELFCVIFKCVLNSLNLSELFKNMLTLITVVIGLGTLIKAIVEYSKAQAWKRAEFLAGVMKEFVNDPNVRLAKVMIDWISRDVELFPENKKKEDKRVWVNDEILIEALTPENWKGTNENPIGYEEHEAKIRDIFDTFFEKLATISHYLETKLITKQDLRPYITHWIGLINGNRSEALISQIDAYLIKYNLSDVIKLLKISKELYKSSK